MIFALILTIVAAITVVDGTAANANVDRRFQQPVATVNVDRRYQQQYHQPQQQHALSHSQPCNVPSDFWCDSIELAHRCNVVSQCETIRRERRPLVVTLMFEALCPYCQRFIANNLGALYSQFGEQIQLELVPWGNSILLRNGQISCNHGPKECDANRLMSCVIDAVPTNQAIPFIVCLERALSGFQPVEQAMQHCSGFIRNSYREIKQCYTGEKGVQLQRQAAHRTANAKAHPIIEVPYLMVNNYSPKTDSNAINIVALQHLIQKWLNQRR